MESYDIEPLEYYKNPLYILGGITLITVIIEVLLFMYSTNTSLKIYFIIVPILSGMGTYHIYNTQCPRCKRIFTKNENTEWEEDLGIKKEPYTYYEREFQYEDGTTEDDESSQKTIMREKKYDRHYFICKKCNHGSNKEWKEDYWIWLGEEPPIKTIKKKGSAMDFGLDLFNDDSYEHQGKRKSIPKSVKKDLWIRNFGKKYKGNCFVCSKSIDTHRFEAGHIKAVAKGGSDNISNLKPICMSCNRSMGTMNLHDFKNKYYKNKIK